MKTFGIGVLFLLPIVSSAQPPGTPAAAETREDGPVASPEPDWPQWNGPRRDGISAEKGLLPTWPEAGPRLAWKIGDLGRGWSSPIIVRDRLYVTGDAGDDLVIYAFDLDGKPLWKATSGRSWTGSYRGARACPAFSEGKLYHMNAHGRVACLDAATGNELWAVNVLERFQGQNITWAMSECLLVDGPRVIVTPGGQKALMAALDKHTGRTVWTTEPLREDRTSHCSPLLFRHAGRRIVASCSSAHGFAADADTGELLWTVPLKNPYGTNITTPVYGSGRIFYTTAYVFGACYRLQPRDGGLQAEKAWDTTLDTCTGTVLLADGRLYGSGYKEHKSWLSLDWKTGAIRYELKDLTTGAAVFADGRLYCLAEDGRAALLRPTPERFEIDGQFRFLPERVSDAWAHPVLLHGRLYLRYHDTLWCYDVRPRDRGR
ncbi:MAG: PQQ-binding-like beta-propeller repeat protein [Thermoguttaceae bacterium]|jgi:outer membrane protein assembly factor BamB